MSLCSSCHTPWSSKIKPAHIPLERGETCVGRWLQLGVSCMMGIEGGGRRKPCQGYCVAACDLITLTGKCQKTHQTHVAGMGWVRVTNSHPIPTPAVTCSTNPHGFINPWHSLALSHQPIYWLGWLNNGSVAPSWAVGNTTNTDLYIDHDPSFSQSHNVTTHKRLEFELSVAPWWHHHFHFKCWPISSIPNDIQYGQKNYGYTTNTM